MDTQHLYRTKTVLQNSRFRSKNTRWDRRDCLLWILFSFQSNPNDAANEYCAENTAILHELVVKIVVILSFFVLMIASHVAFFETEDFSFEDDGVRRNRAASTFLALVVARDSLCSFLEHLARSSVWVRPVTRLRNVYEARVKSTQPKTLRRTRSNVNIC